MGKKILNELNMHPRDKRLKTILACSAPVVILIGLVTTWKGINNRRPPIFYDDDFNRRWKHE